MGSRIEVAESLRKRKPGREQWVLNTENLTHTPCPADALADMSGQALCGETRRLRNVDVGCVPAKPVHAQGSVSIFGYRLHCDTANLIERFAPQHRTRSAEEARIPKIVPILHEAVKQLVFIGDFAELSQISLKRIRGIEVMRSLHHTKTGVR